jgi:hypothetical protein
MKLPLYRIAHARSGDKGDISNVGVIARRPEWYKILLREVTAERVKAHFAGLVLGKVTRYELQNVQRTLKEKLTVPRFCGWKSR